MQVLRQGEHLISACGSPHYAAPEVILAKETGGGYRFECDMWAVGVICYTLLWYVTALSLDHSALRKSMTLHGTGPPENQRNVALILELYRDIGSQGKLKTAMWS